MFYDLTQDHNIYLSFLICMAMATFPFNLNFSHEKYTQYESINGSSTCFSCHFMWERPNKRETESAVAECELFSVRSGAHHARS
jgi:hypothetical protein